MMSKRFKSPAMLAFLTSLVLCTCNAARGGILFSVEIARDTVLVYEEIDLRLLFRNDSAEAFIRKPFTVSPEFKIAKLINVNTGEEIDVINIALNQFTSQEEKAILLPGEEQIGTDAILLRLTARFADSERGIRYLPPSTYEVVCVWIYDPEPGIGPRATPMIWEDTVRFTVIPATGRNRDAQKRFQAAYNICREETPQKCAEAYWQVASQYPESPYATEAIGRVIGSVLRYQNANLPNVDIDSILQTFILARPDSWRCRRFLQFAVKRLAASDLRRFLADVRGSAPRSFASKEAERLLSEVENRE